MFSNCENTKSTWIESLAVQSLAVQSLAVQSLAFQSLAVQSLAVYVMKIFHDFYVTGKFIAGFTKSRRSIVL